MTNLLERRRAGVLLHPSSLPGDSYSGTLGADARRFADLLAAAGLQIWQVLPLGPTYSDQCPYQSISVHAGNSDLIDLQWLVEQGWLTQHEADAGGAAPRAKRMALDLASKVFFAQFTSDADKTPVVAAYEHFLQQSAYWLEDYVRFQAFRDDLGRRPWTTWPTALRNSDADACDQRDQSFSGRFRAGWAPPGIMTRARFAMRLTNSEGR